MAAAFAPMPGIPEALHRAEKDLPFVEYQEGVVFQFLQADVATGLWVIRVRFQPGVTNQRHRHTGEVFAFTIRGSWNYVEYPELNTAGSYLFEPAGSIHTLYVPGSNKEVTDVWFAIRGANLNLDEAGNVESVLDAGAVLEIYRARCEKSGLAHPDVIGAQAVRATVWNKVKGGLPCSAQQCRASCLADESARGQLRKSYIPVCAVNHIPEVFHPSRVKLR